jgi:hypothetical protein
MYAYRLSEHVLIWINTKLRGVDLTDKVPRQERRKAMSGERRDKIMPTKRRMSCPMKIRKLSLTVSAARTRPSRKELPTANRMKVSEKGAVSVYGMGRFPVTLYKEQWLKLLNMSDEICAFIAENEARLKAKD